MKYFLHDSNAFQDEKITELFMEFGFEGLGLFYTILEKLAMQEKPIKTDVLKMQLFVGRKLERCWKFLESSGLISSNNGETFNENLLKFSEKYQVKKDKNRERITEWRKNQAFADDVTRYNSVTERVRNSPKDNISKVNKSKVKGKAHSAECDPSPKDGFDFVEGSIKEAGKASLNASLEKAAHTGGRAAAKKREHLFKDSEYFDRDVFKAKFSDPEYASVDLDYYYNAVYNWSEGGDNTKVDWLATARGFMNRDRKDGKLAISRNKVIPLNPKLTNYDELAKEYGPVA